MSRRYRIGIDVGGTFTDLVAADEQGTVTIAKSASTPADPSDGLVDGLGLLARELGTDLRGLLAQTESIVHGTTVATNALLERKGERTVLFITRGFRDALRIAYQNRPRIFDRHIVLPEMLYSKVVEVEERVGAHGEVVVPLNEAQVVSSLKEAFAEGYRSVAIVFMHGYRYTEHEATVAELAKEAGFTQVSVSHRVSPLMKLVGRGDTTVVDAYLSPILRRCIRLTVLILLQQTSCAVVSP